MNTVTDVEHSCKQTSWLFPQLLSLAVFLPSYSLLLAIPGNGKGLLTWVCGSWEEVVSGLVMTQWERTCFLPTGILSIGLAAAYYSGGENRHLLCPAPRSFLS